MNRSDLEEIDGVPIVSVYTPDQQKMFWDDATPEPVRHKATAGELGAEVQIFENPKAEWNEVKEAAVNLQSA